RRVLFRSSKGCRLALRAIDRVTGSGSFAKTCDAILLGIARRSLKPVSPGAYRTGTKGQDLHRSNRNSPANRHRLRYSAWVHRAIRDAEKISATRGSDFSVNRQIAL